MQLYYVLHRVGGVAGAGVRAGTGNSVLSGGAATAIIAGAGAWRSCQRALLFGNFADGRLTTLHGLVVKADLVRWVC